MAEKVKVWQNSQFQIRFWTQLEGENAGGKLDEVEHIHQLNPYSMMLASLAACTAIVLHTYAQNHHLPLEEVELRMQYDRNYKKDCEDCPESGEYTEEVQEEIYLKGKLSDEERQKLMTIAHACPIYKIYKDGITIQTKLGMQ